MSNRKPASLRYPERDAYILQQFTEKRRSAVSIAEEMGVTLSTVQSVIKKNGATGGVGRGGDRRPEVLKVGKNGVAYDHRGIAPKTERNRAIMAALLVERLTRREVREKFGITDSTLAGVIDRYKNKFEDLPRWETRPPEPHARATAAARERNRAAEALRAAAATAAAASEGSLRPAPSPVQRTPEELQALAKIQRLFSGGSQDYPILRLTDRTCRWPVAGSGAATEYCCGPRARGSYCSTHADRAYVAVRKFVPTRGHQRKRG
jgi:hypothetical protein